MDLAIIVPALNEREALPGLIAEIDAACGKLGLEWETLVVDDGSTDKTFEMVEELAQTNDRVWAIRLRRNFGKSVALAVGFDATDADLVITIDGDG
ncbi:MAG: glycosyltransferase, partial [Solirubrobacterales bacterium]|nr:glycosyltransferase [Solirubrobacterales bacterium]